MQSPQPSQSTDNAHPRAAMAVMILALATLAETRDSDTGKHILRVQHYVRTLALQLQSHPRFAAVLTDAYISALFVATPLYDMGTIGIPDRILLKPGRLTAGEYAVMKTHTTLAYEALVQAEQVLGYQPEETQVLKDIAYCHQEKWDGSGYPQGLSGDKIPLAARLVAIADVYDALISDRVYKAGVLHEQAVGIIFQGYASHFDPDIVDAFIAVQQEFDAIAHRYPDTDQDMQKMIEYMANAIAEDANI